MFYDSTVYLSYSNNFILYPDFLIYTLVLYQEVNYISKLVHATNVRIIAENINTVTRLSFIRGWLSSILLYILTHRRTELKGVCKESDSESTCRCDVLRGKTNENPSK